MNIDINLIEYYSSAGKYAIWIQPSVYRFLLDFSADTRALPSASARTETQTLE